MKASIATAAACVLLLGCESTTVCTRELRYPITVEVSSPFGLEVDSVTAKSSTGTGECEGAGLDGPGGAPVPAVDVDGGVLTYRCAERGAGSYLVTVHSGELSWSKLSRYFARDGCHPKGHQTLEFLLDPDTAD